MIFFLRIIVFSFFIILGFRISVCSIKGRGAVSLIYGFVLLYYTFLIRVKITVDVVASDYTSSLITQRSVGEKVLQLLKLIFGMQPNGNFAGNYREAFVLNVLLMIPLGYLVLLHFLCGDAKTSVSPEGTEARDVITDDDASHVKDTAATEARKAYLANNALKSILICIITSFVIEITQEISGLGMFDINDLLANTIGGGMGIFLTLVWMRKHTCAAPCDHVKRVEK